MIIDDFCIPQIYINIDKLGWTKNCNEYVWFNDMEWISIEEILHCKEHPEKYLINSPSVIPFAQTGGGDIWGWYIEDRNNPFVVLCYHDESTALVYAQNFESALFRHIIEFVSEANFYSSQGESYQMGIAEAKTNIANWRNKFGNYFKPEWNLEIEQILSLELKKCVDDRCKKSYEYEAFITYQEADAIIKKYLYFDKIDSEVVWDIENI